MNNQEILNALENSSLSFEEKQIKEALEIALKNPQGVISLPGLPPFAFSFQVKLEVAKEAKEEPEIEEPKPETKGKKGK